MRGQLGWVKIQPPACFWCDLKKFLNLSEPQFPHLLSESYKAQVPGKAQGSKVIFEKS